MVFKFCANLTFQFNETDNLLERYRLASEAGFQAVEYLFPYSYSIDDLIKAKTEANVSQVVINAYPGDLQHGDLGLAAKPGREKEFRASLDRSIDYAKALGCTKIHIMSGKNFAGIVDTAMKEIYLENLKYASKLFADNGITGLIEPISQQAVPNYFMDSFKTAVQIIEEVNSDNLKLLLDVFHLQLIDGNLTQRIRELLPVTAHIQVSQAPNRHSPEHEGEIDYKYILKLLEELGYDGFIGLEYKPEKPTVETLSWIKKWNYEL